MYAWYECHYFIGTGTEAELLIKLLTSRVVMLQDCPDSLDGVRELYCRIEVLPKEAILYFCCKGRSVLLSTERALRISLDYYNTARSGHLDLKVGVVRHRIETGKCDSSEQCVITTAEGDDIEE